MGKAMIDINSHEPLAWLGHLSATIGHYLNGPFDEKDLRQAYAAYRDSPAVDDELRRLLPEPKKGGAR